MPEENLTPPPVNTPEARTPTGELLNQSQPTTPAPETPTNEAVAKPEGAPEAYTDYTAPEGYKLDAKLIGEVNPIFKELGLSQAQAQKLVDWYSATDKGRADSVMAQYNKMQEDWVAEIKSDPNIGPKLPQVQAQIGRLWDALGDTKLATEAKAALDFTGAGNNPAIVRAFIKLADLVTEGQHVTGNSPSSLGQTPPGTTARPSMAASMYPNLNSATRQ